MHEKLAKTLQFKKRLNLRKVCLSSLSLQMFNQEFITFQISINFDQI